MYTIGLDLPQRQHYLFRCVFQLTYTKLGCAMVVAHQQINNNNRFLFSPIFRVYVGSLLTLRLYVATYMCDFGWAVSDIEWNLTSSASLFLAPDYHSFSFFLTMSSWNLEEFLKFWFWLMLWRVDNENKNDPMISFVWIKNQEYLIIRVLTTSGKVNLCRNYESCPQNRDAAMMPRIEILWYSSHLYRASGEIIGRFSRCLKLNDDVVYWKFHESICLFNVIVERVLESPSYSCHVWNHH